MIPRGHTRTWQQVPRGGYSNVTLDVKCQKLHADQVKRGIVHMSIPAVVSQSKAKISTEHGIAAYIYYA